jgi:nucleotide-binding universal stress UspA family protein
VIEESPAFAIMRLADQEHADMIVVGRRGRGGFTELLLGSVSHQLVHHAKQPLVIISRAE